MKKSIYIVLGGLLTLGFVGCEPEFDNPVNEVGFYTTGDADMSNFVAVGNSLTAGYADGALYITGQENSYPNILAQQFALAGGGEFTQPLVNDNLGGLLLNGTQVAENRFVLAADPMTGAPLGPVRLEGTPTTEVTTSAVGPFNNMGVPGAKSFHLVTSGYAGLNPYFGRFATSGSATVLADAVSLNPSFFSLWIGNNDILSYATSGGAGVDQTGNLDPSTYGSNDITDPNVFASVYSQQVAALMAGASGGVLINIADVTSIPYFTTVPVRSIPLNAATAGAVNAQFALYNTQVLPGLVGGGVISAEEAAARQINFSAGANFPIMMDDDLTDLTMILQGSPFNLPAPIAGLLGQLRQANDDDLVVLTASSVLGTLADPNNPQSVIGVAVPLEDQFVLTAVEQGRVSVAARAYNITISSLASANDLVLVDVRRALGQVANGGIAYDGGLLTNIFATGGAFSLDGVHPTPRGYAYTANLIIDGINRKYNATIPNVNIGDYGTITITNNGGN
jgi:hypothetical protein